jgi:EPS-associated MarR family transcriptional regulator
LSPPNSPPALIIEDEHRYQILKLLEANPQMNQRELASTLGISLGKVNYCLTALIKKGLVKANNFKNHRNKAAYAYLLTPVGLNAKASATYHFLQRKIREYETLQKEIAVLRIEAAKLRSDGALPPENR